MEPPLVDDLDPERQRLAEADEGTQPWREWGPYVAQRAWGTVREDYSADGDAWASFPFDHAVSRTYRWNEDGLLAWSDDQQRLCLGLALWNGVDANLKERAFGLSGHEGNHGEDVKEYWWYLDNTPTHSWMRCSYLYPIKAFPISDLRTINDSRTRDEHEFELADTGVFGEDRYVEVATEWAKRSPRDICMRIRLSNKGPESTAMHVLPTAWFRNTWSWSTSDVSRPNLKAVGATIQGSHPTLGPFSLASEVDGEHDAPAVLCCENETNVGKLYGSDTWAGEPATPYPKDGINDHVVRGAATVNPAGIGTKAAFHHVISLAAGETREVRVRLRLGADPLTEVGGDFEALMSSRAKEADAFWIGLLGALDAETANVARRSLAGLLSTKQYYAYDVATWLSGDPLQPTPPVERLKGRNVGWTHLSASDVIVMPDGWEYPWFASWDLAFHCVALAHVDPALAKSQLLLLLSDRYQHPSGQIPAYEWNFNDMNPPVQAWAALQVFHIDGSRDRTFLEQVLHKLVMNVTWWLNRVDVEGDNLFEGGFLGLDNIGPFDRSIPMPDGSVLEQSDGTAWTAMYCLDLLTIAVTLGAEDPAYDGISATFLDRFCKIATAANDMGLWDDEDGFYYDLLRHPNGEAERVRVRSVVGLIPLAAVGHLPQKALAAMPKLSERLVWLRSQHPELAKLMHFEEDRYLGLLAVCDPTRLLRVLHRMLDEAEFLSQYGIRSLSAAHRTSPVTVVLAGHSFTVDYEPAESRSWLYGGNSNWRGPVWLPINVLLIAALRRYHEYCKGDLLVACPTGKGEPTSLSTVADDLSDRLTSLFRRSQTGDIPSMSGQLWQQDPLFFEYFDGDTGRGLGASHQTGWTALVASLALGWPR